MRLFEPFEETMVNMQKEEVLRVHDWRGGLLGILCALELMVPAPAALAAAAEQKSFASPEAAVTALVDAVKLNDQPLLNVFLGSHGNKLVSSGDAVEDKRGRDAFIKAYNETHKLVLEGDMKAVLVIGHDGWPMPIPLIKSNRGWRFDTRQGEREILSRRIGRNELATVQVCLAIVDAERDYAAQDLDGDGILEYAPRLVSTPGKRDGLYWRTTTAGEPPSPLGPLLAAAARDGYTRPDSMPLAPYHGYFYRILTRQGKDVAGGAYNYLVKGAMIGGFAVIAYPARYGASGVMSFMVNQDGVVYEKNLGKNTAAIAARMMTYNPDASWKRH
jgi:hypothetical protein